MTTWAAVARFGGIGDNLIVSSVLPGLKKKYDRLEVLTCKPQGVVFENNPNIDKLTYIKDGDIPSAHAEEWQGWFTKRSHEYEALYHMSHTLEMDLALFPGQGKFNAIPEFRRKYCGISYLEYAHDFCGIPYAPIGARFYPTDAEIATAQQDKVEKLLNGSGSGRPLIGYVCSGTRVDKRHPLAGIVLARLISELGATVVLFGGPHKDRAIGEEIEGQVRKHNRTLDGIRSCISLSDKDDTWPIRRSLTQLQHCDMVITPDTGPGWAVSMCPIPKILMVSHASAENIGKYWVDTTVLEADRTRVPCYPCHRLHTDFTTCTPNFENDGPACTSDISVEAIVRCAKLWMTQKETARQLIAKTMTTDDVLATVPANPAFAPDMRQAWGEPLHAIAAE